MSEITDLQITLGDIERELIQTEGRGSGKRKNLRRGKNDGKGEQRRDGSGPECQGEDCED